MQENLFDVIFQLGGIWFYFGGIERNSVPVRITFVAVLEEKGNRYVRIYVDPQKFLDDFSLIIHAEIEEQKKRTEGAISE